MRVRTGISTAVRTGLAVVAVVAAAGVGLAVPATAQHPGVNGLVAHADDQFADLPCVLPPGSAPETPLTRYAGAAIAWSPDGGRFAADLESPDASRDVLVVDVTDCSVVDLGPAGGRGLSFSPDGTRLALVRDDDVVVVDAATGAVLEQVTSTPGVAESDPAWSPLGGTIAYAGEGGIRVWPGHALVVPGGAQPDFSPDGTRLAYAPGGYGLAHAAADGSDAVVLPDRFGASDVVWSPDGRVLLYTGDYAPPGGTPDVGCWFVTPDGTRVSRLPSPNLCSVPAWQPLPAGSTPVPFPEPQPEVTEPTEDEVTLGYLYPLLDPSAPPSQANSGVQQLHAITGGYVPFAEAVELTGWADVCGDAWGYRQVHVALPWDELPYTVDPAADPLAGLVVAEEHRRVSELADTPACEPEEPVELTLTYLYRKLDPTRPPSWGNSGPQVLLDVRDGHARHREFLGALPADVCGPGWAVQQDFTVGLAADDVPATLDRLTARVLGWGDVVVAARHHSLEFYGPVPACGAGATAAAGRAV